MEEEPLVSVLMTAYNRERYIAEAIESVLSSTYQNWELIIVDDCSKDRTVEIAKSFVFTDDRIKVYVNERNLGQFQNRNKAASYAKGKYLKYLDSDDLIYPHGLEVMVWAIGKFPGSAFAISYPKPEDTLPYPIQLSPEESYKEQFLGRGVMDVGPSATIFDSSIFMKFNGYKEDGYVGNDNEILFNMAASYPIIKMPTALIWWRQHENQAFDKGNKTNEYLFKHFGLIIDTLNSNNCPLSASDKIKAIKRQKHHHARKILSIAIQKKHLFMAWEIFKYSKLSFFELLKGLKKYE
jgi:glycosyltransferase involved in cell wall biosynthesis